MSLLTEDLPDSIIVHGKKYAVNTDFATWIKFSSVINDRKKDVCSKLTEIIRLCFDPEKCPALPPDAEAMLTALYEFFCCGKVQKDEKKHEGRRKDKRVFGFEEDGDYIYAAFLEQYGIDLTEKKDLHWWRFSALFKGLDENVRLMKIIAYRSADIGKIKDTARRGFYSRMKELYALADDRTAEEKEKALAETLSEIF